MRTARRWKLDSFARAANRQAIIPLPALAGVLKEHRAQNPDEQELRGIQITINGISAGLRNSG
jgi:phosphoenolpyruvate carboxylase